MNRSDYVMEAKRQLCNTNHYSRLKSNPMKEIQITVENKLESWRKEELINEDECKFITVKYPRIPTIYFLPKIHKSLTKPPGSPIVSACDSLFENMSRYIDYYLCPIVQTLPSYKACIQH